MHSCEAQTMPEFGNRTFIDLEQCFVTRSHKYSKARDNEVSIGLSMIISA